MPIRIPDQLPARVTLETEGVVVMDQSRSARQDIRPLQFGLLNLMPNKQRTETQFARLIASTPLQIDLTLVRVADPLSKSTPEDYLQNFYSTWEDVRAKKFDGFVVTGAPIANMPFEDVRYWPEMLEIIDWTQTNVHHTMFICWGAQAALHHLHGVRRYRMDHKAFGVYRHKVLDTRHPFLRGFSDDLAVPVSRYNDIDRQSLSPRIRQHLAGRRIPPRHRGRTRNPDARGPVPRQRSGQNARKPLAQPRAPSVPELDQRDLPDNALRSRQGRHGRVVD